MEPTPPIRSLLRPAAWLMTRTVVVVGTLFWLAHRLDLSISGQLQRLVASDEAATEALNTRLRSLEESTARAEAEMRFLASRLDSKDTSDDAADVVLRRTRQEEP